jgi:multicomponent Na+:H+ antiporter subunit G
VVALDLISILTAGTTAVYALAAEQPVFLDVALVLALISFLRTVAFARYLERQGFNNEILSSALMLVGATFALLAGAGVVRMPDLFTRMQAATKASTLGIGCIILAVAVHFGVGHHYSRPRHDHLCDFDRAYRRAYDRSCRLLIGVPLWDQTIIDELHGHYDRRTDKLARPDDPLATLPMTVDLRRLTGQTVLVSYGRVGRRIGEALIANAVSIVVVEDGKLSRAYAKRTCRQCSAMPRNPASSSRRTSTKRACW